MPIDLLVTGYPPLPIKPGNVEALLDALWQTLSRTGSLSLQRCLAWQLEGAGQIFVNQLVASFGDPCVDRKWWKFDDYKVFKRDG